MSGWFVMMNVRNPASRSRATAWGAWSEARHVGRERGDPGCPSRGTIRFRTPSRSRNTAAPFIP